MGMLSNVSQIISRKLWPPTVLKPASVPKPLAPTPYRVGAYPDILMLFNVELINLSPKLNIMKREVTVDLFRQVMRGYEITGHKTDELKAALADSSKAREAVVLVSLNDAREFAIRLSQQTGRKFRVQTEAEWLQAKNQLSGRAWEWTKTEYSKNLYILRSLSLADWDVSDPACRWDFTTIRLVEDL